MLQAVQARRGKRGWKKEQGHLKTRQEEDRVCARPWVCVHVPRGYVGRGSPGWCRPLGAVGLFKGQSGKGALSLKRTQ